MSGYPLGAAKRFRFLVFSMKNDWPSIFRRHCPGLFQRHRFIGHQKCDVLNLIVASFRGYVATNVDNLCILLASISSRKDHRYAIFNGYILGSLVLILDSLCCARLLVRFSLGDLAFLGLIPMATGFVPFRRAPFFDFMAAMRLSKTALAI
jgi:hypothetical protein